MPLAIAAVGTWAMVLAAGSVPGKSDVLASSYALADVMFEFAEGDKSIQIDGSGKGTVFEKSALKNQSASPFRVQPVEVFQLLQLCYREQLFDLPTTYGPPNTVRLRPDGIVETSSTAVADAAWSSVTVTIGGYRKSVAYLKGHGNVPAVVVELERRIKELAMIGSRSDVRGGRSSNYALDLPVRPVTVLASARTAPGRPAGQRDR